MRGSVLMLAGLLLLSWNALCAESRELGPQPPLDQAERAQRLWRLLGQSPTLTIRDQDLLWSAGSSSAALRVLDVTGLSSDPLIATAAGPLLVPRRLLGRVGLAATVAAAAKRAAAAGWHAEQLTISEGPLLGVVLARSGSMATAHMAVGRAATVAMPAPWTMRERWIGDDAELLRLDGPIGTVWTVRYAQRCAYSVIPPQWRDADGILIVELPSGSDPLAMASERRATPLSARLLIDGSWPLATWTADNGLMVDEDRWRQRSGGRVPHVLMLAPHGLSIGLASAYGVWHRRSGEDHIATLARTLREAVDLASLSDLFEVDDAAPPVAFDDALRALGLGALRIRRSDFADVVHAILRRQARPAQRLNLGHRPWVAWCEAISEGRWMAHAVSDGEVISCDGAQPAAACARLLQRLDEWRMPDPDAVPIRVRVGERILDTVAGVDALRAIEPGFVVSDGAVLTERWAFAGALDALLRAQARDDEPGTRRLVAQAYAACARPASAAAVLRADADRSSDPVRRRAAAVAHMRYVALHDAQAAAVEAAVLAARFADDPDAAAVADAAVLVAEALAAARRGAQAVDMLDRFATARAGMALAAIQRAAAAGATTHTSESVGALAFLDRYQRAGIATLRTVGRAPGRGNGRDSAVQSAELAAARSRVADVIERWARLAAFRSGTREARFADIGDYYASELNEGNFLSLLATAEVPERAPDVSERPGGVAQIRLDLPWIRASAATWIRRMDADRSDAPAEQAVRWLGGAPTPGIAPRPGIARAAAVVLAARHTRALRPVLNELAASGDADAIWRAAAWLGRDATASAIPALPRQWLDAGLDSNALLAMLWGALRDDAARGRQLAMLIEPLLRSDPVAARECALILQGLR